MRRLKSYSFIHWIVFVFGVFFELHSSFYRRCLREKYDVVCVEKNEGSAEQGESVDCRVSIVPCRSEQMRSAQVGKGKHSGNSASSHAGRPNDIYIRDFDRRLPLVGRAENAQH